MKMLRAVVLAIGLGLLVVAPVSADHGQVNGPQCAVHEYHGEQNMTKGRTGGIVYHVDHTVGCSRLIMSNLSPAGPGEAQGNAGQMARADRYAREEAVNAFNYRFHITVNPEDIVVRTTPWTGDD